MARTWHQDGGTFVVMRLISNARGWDFDARSPTSRFSRSGNHDSWPTSYMAFRTWLGENDHVVLVAHGCFRKDKPVFEHLMRFYSLPYTHNVTFFDTLYWCRRFGKGKSQSLKAIYLRQFGTIPPELHCARGHVDALWRILDSTPNPLSGFVYPPFLTPLQNVHGIGGLNEQLCIRSHILCVEDLCHLMRQMNDVDTFATMLHRTLHIKAADSHVIAKFIREFSLTSF